MLLENLFTLLLVTFADGRIFGEEWGWILKPNGLNTIVSNDCVSRRSVYVAHSHSRTRGTHVSRMLENVSTRDTSKAIMDIIRAANGHSPVRCSPSEVRHMENEYKKCAEKIQYQLKCYDMSRDQQCFILNSFLEDCTRDVLGQCFQTEYLQYIYNVQTWSMANHKTFQDVLGDVCLTEDVPKDPSLKTITTSRPEVINRSKLLRRYLRHPAISKYK